MKKTDEKQNPLHREYGLMSNIRWTLSAMRQHSKGLLTLIPIGIVCAPLMNYLWTFISKFVIDMITGEAGWQALLWIMGIFTVIQLVSTMLNTYYNSETGWRFIDARFKLVVLKYVHAEYQRESDVEQISDSDVADACFFALEAVRNEPQPHAGNTDGGDKHDNYGEYVHVDVHQVGNNRYRHEIREWNQHERECSPHPLNAVPAPEDH